MVLNLLITTSFTSIKLYHVFVVPAYEGTNRLNLRVDTSFGSPKLILRILLPMTKIISKEPLDRMRSLWNSKEASAHCPSLRVEFRLENHDIQQKATYVRWL